MEKWNLTWLRAAIVRAVKTAAQTAIGMITVGAAFSDIDWVYVASVSGVAAILSLLTSIAGLPETTTVGTLNLDEVEPVENGMENYYVDVPSDLTPKDGDIVSFKVKRKT